MDPGNAVETTTGTAEAKELDSVEDMENSNDSDSSGDEFSSSDEEDCDTKGIGVDEAKKI